jgi:hypothetical protein
MRSFVTATMIAQRLRSPNRDGQELLPQLVAKLIKNSVSPEVIHEFRFSDRVYLHGEDGVLVVQDTVQHLYVPSGISVWEMGTETPPRSKANKDFPGAEAKLANAFPNMVPPVSPDKATAVFVTSGIFQDHEKWVRENRQNSTWKSIRVIDAVSLADWLEQCPAVMLWFANECGLPAEGLYDAEQYIRKLGVGFGVSALSPELVIAGRDQDVKRLTALVVESNAEIHIHAESIEEAAAFLASASLKEADAYGMKPPLVFSDSQADLNLLATCGAQLTLVPVDSEALARFKIVGVLKWRAIFPEVKSTAPRTDVGHSLTLGQSKRPAIEHHLIDQMGFPDHRARPIARDSKGSLIALLWLVGSGPLGTPRWATRKDATTHASLILAGSWIGNNENDTKVIERLSRQTYRDIETVLQSAEIPEGPWIHRGVEWLCASKDFVWGQLVGKVTETMLQDFLGIVLEVVGERDPSLELPQSERHMASIMGKTRKYSSSLRGGLVDCVARLAVLKTDGQGWADRVVHSLLDPTASDVLGRWLSTRDVCSEIAEASPDVFLQCLDAVLRMGEARGFFQDEGSADILFSPTSAHVYLLWALERLAWQKEYFSRVLSTLAKLAEIDPGGRIHPRPKDSLATILLPWCPQHTESMQDAAGTLRMLYSISPAVTWDVATTLLPASRDVTSPTPRPAYREHPAERQVSVKEYWEFIGTVVQLMIEWAGRDVGRWGAIVKAYPELRRGYPELARLVTDGLGQIHAAIQTDAEKAVVHDALRELISRHRDHPDAEWALPKSDLDILESLGERFKPEDAVLQCAHLFSWDPDVPGAPMKSYEDGWDEWIAQQRAIAGKAVYDQDGLEGICRLAQTVVLADCVGEAGARLPLTEIELVELFEKGLKAQPSCYAEDSPTRMVRGYVWAKYKMEGEEWLESVLALRGITWTPEAYANLALGLPPSPMLWKRLEQWGPEADSLYWKNVDVRGRLREHWPQVLAKWKEVMRPWSSLELVAHLIDARHADTGGVKPSTEDVMDVLTRALEADESIEPQRRQGAMLTYYVEHAFLYLDSQSIDIGKLAKLEWGWLRALEHTERGVKALQSQVTSSPELFIELLKAVYFAEGESRNDNIPEDRRRVASQASRLLERIHTLPAYQSGIAGEAGPSSPLHAWVLRTRELAKEAGRLRVCDTHIGQILSYSPQSADGSWPCVEVRDVIEEVQSAGLENGLRIGKYNQRGVVCRGAGGKQEWDLAKDYRALADKVRNGWPRTASILDGLAKDYESEARHWDEQAKRDEYE